VLNDASQAIIDDDLAGTGEHSIEAAWHFPNSWHLELGCGNQQEVLCALQGPLPVEMKFSSSTRLTVASAPAAVSRCYGSVLTGRVLTVSANSELPFRLRTEISWAQA
jgi:hypothetical protein